MRRSWVLLSWLGILGCHTSSFHWDAADVFPQAPPPVLDDFPEPGKCLPEARSPYLFSVHRGRTLCAARVEHKGITYDLDAACDTHVVLRLATEDPNFRTPEGVRMGATIAETLEAGGLVLDADCNVALASGWTAEGGPCDDDARETKVRRFVKKAPQFSRGRPNNPR